MKERKNYKAVFLKKLYSEYINCTLCPLSKTRNTIVFGRGNPDAKILFIGEAPGKNEDELGIPFVGQSGKLLMKVCSNLKITEEDYYITNIAKCRPPQNRPPTNEEAFLCKNILLEKQIEIIQPHVICTLGKTAFTFLFAPIKKDFLRGLVSFYKKIPVVSTYHPAYILRCRSKLTILQEDIQKAITILNQGPP